MSEGAEVRGEEGEEVVGEAEHLETGEVVDVRREADEAVVVEIQHHQVVQRTCNSGRVNYLVTVTQCLEYRQTYVTIGKWRAGVWLRKSTWSCRYYSA